MAMLQPKHMLILRYLLLYIALTLIGIHWVDKRETIKHKRQLKQEQKKLIKPIYPNCSGQALLDWINPDKPCPLTWTAWSVDSSGCRQNWSFSVSYSCLVKRLKVWPQSVLIRQIKTEREPGESKLRVVLNVGEVS
jgi:hypothetical protein